MKIAGIEKSYDEKEYRKNYYLANKEKASAKAKERYQKNKEAIKKECRDRYHKNPDKYKECSRKRYENNKERSYEQSKKWAQNNREKSLAIKARYRHKNRDELRRKGLEYMAGHKEEQNAYKRVWRANNPDKLKEEKLKNRFNMSLEDFNNLMESQKGLCGICSKVFNSDKPLGMDYPCIDHDHSTKKNRGILCRRCNSGIGGFHDSIKLLNSAFLWLTTKDYNRTSPIVPIEIFIPPRKKYYLKKEFNITVNQFISMVALQDCKCGICGNPFLITETKNKGSSSYNIDHCHSSKKIRGVLCPLCNKAQGLLKDNPEIIQNAIEWLKKGSSHENSRD